MVHARVEFEKPAVEHVRYPCNRVPVGRVIIYAECPDEIVWRKSFFYMWIIRHINSVIKADEIMFVDILIYNTNDKGKYD